MNFKQFYLAESEKELIGYHSSNAKFTEFSHKFTGGVGFYFTPENTFKSNDEFWNSYAKNKKYTYRCRITLKNQPGEDVSKEVNKIARGGNPRKMMVDKYLELGYDGLDQSPAQIWVFDPKSIEILDVVENINETIEFPKPNIIDYVGKFGIDKKIQSFEKMLSKTNIFEVTDKKIVYGTDANKIKVDVESGEDKQEQIEWETKLYNKQLKEYNELLKHYYDKVYEMDFINNVDLMRKSLNNKMKAIVGSYILLRELAK